MGEIAENGHFHLISAKEPVGFEIYFGDTLVVDDLVRCLYVKGPKVSEGAPDYFMLIDVKDGDVYMFSDDMDDLWRYVDVKRVIANWNSEYRRAISDSARLN